MFVIYGLGPGEVLVIVAVAVIIAFLMGLWAGRKAYGPKEKEEIKKKSRK